MEEKVINLPIVLAGERIEVTPGMDTLSISYDSGARVVLPRVEKKALERLQQTDRFLLHDVPVQEIISFFGRVGRFWAPDNAAHPLYQQAVTSLSYINGYAPKMARRQMNVISALVSLQSAWHDLLDAELGNRYYLEEWLPNGDALLHAQPMGNAVHILVGNVPVSGVMSLVRSAITKNRTIAKLAKRDPITSLFFVLSCLEVDPQHPVSRSMTALYWPGGDEIESAVLGMANVVCVWGGASAVREVKAKVGAGTEVLEFGPKSSFALVGRESVASKRVAMDLAHDVSIYDQEACFSPQMAFVEGDYKLFVENLAEALRTYGTLVPKGEAPMDVHAHVTRTRLEALYGGSELVQSPGTEWSIIVIKDPSEINEHPLSRVIFVVPVNDIKECIPYCNSETQTVTVSPWQRSVEIREQVTLRGACKVTEIGLVEAMRVGSTHDAIYPLQRMVRWVCVERGCDHWGKYVQQGPIDTTRWLMMHQAQLEQVES